MKVFVVSSNKTHKMLQNPKTTLEAILFDFDGTLRDTMSLIRKLFEEELRKKGVEEFTDDVEDRIRSALYDLFNTTSVITGVILVPRMVWVIGRKAGLSRFNCFRLLSSITGIINETYNQAELFPDVQESLDLVSGARYRLGVVTTAPRKTVEGSLTRHGIREYFEVVVSRTDVKRVKPDPEACLLAAETLNVNPERCVFIGDLFFDILAGQRAGMTTVGVTTGLQGREELEELKPNAIFPSLKEAVQWIISLE